MKSSVRTGNLLSGALLAWVCAAVLAQVSGAVDPDLARDLAAIDPARHIERLASIPSRVTGYEGCTEAEQYIFEQYRELGLANIKLEPFQIIVPVDKGAELRVGEAVIPLKCVWPNGVRTSKTTESGVTGPLIWAGDGELNEFNGKNVDGSIVLMNFNTATRWLDAAKLGARAIIFLEPRYAFRSDAEQKYLTIPVPVPRYYLERKHFATLAEAVLGGPPIGAAAGEGDPLDVIADLGRLGLPEARATVVADMIWEEVTANMVSGELPGTDPELGEEALVLHAYYDSASVVPALAPGAESACGIAAQLEIGAFLLKHPPRRTVKLLATPGHFQALAGARHYAFKYVFPRRAEELKARGLPEEETSRGEPFFFIGLDLSSRQRTMAGFYKGHFYDQLGETGETDIQRIFSDYSSLLLEWADEVTGAGGPAQGLKFQSGIVPLHGRKWRALLPDKMAFDAEVLGMSQRPAITLATTGDNRGGVNTPLDTYAMLEPALENVRAQAILCALIVKQTADTPILPTPQQMNAANVRTERLGSIFGRAIEQTLSAYIPQQPVPDAVAVAELSKAKTMMGVQGLAYVRTDVQ
ncbi:MAG: M28 family peptidase, partial [Candidatus Brocadiia bacterium]|nr:M28 family peptidase [Candidatus Brocadiia bacterium]